MNKRIRTSDVHSISVSAGIAIGHLKGIGMGLFSGIDSSLNEILPTSCRLKDGDD